MSKRSNRILDALMAAFKAKDAEEVEKLAEKVGDDLTAGPDGEAVESGTTHIHIHPDGSAGAQGSAGEAAPAGFADAREFEAHKDQNAKEHEEFRKRLDALEKSISGGNGSTAASSDEEAMPEEALDEVPEELRAEAAKAKDSAYLGDSFQNTIAMAEILVPGIRVPTYDRAERPGLAYKRICGLRRQALDLAYAQPATRSVLDDLLAGKNLSTKNMTCDAIRVLFNQAATAQRVVNNSSRGARDTGQQYTQAAKPLTLAELNRRNAERYKS